MGLPIWFGPSHGQTVTQTTIEVNPADEKPKAKYLGTNLRHLSGRHVQQIRQVA